MLTGMPGPVVDDLVVTALLGAVGLVGLLLLRNSPRVAVALWLVVLGFVPVWAGVSVVYYLLPGTVVGLVALVALRRARWEPITWADLAVLALFAAIVSPVLLPVAWSLSQVFAVLTQWILAFVIGRLAMGATGSRWLYGTVTVVMVIVAALAIAEFLLSVNPWMAIPGDPALTESWARLQVRGDVIRAEGAWGHSIALGSALAMTIPLALGSGMRLSWRIAAVGVLAAGSLVTFSRLGILGAGLATIAGVYALVAVLSPRTRAALLVGIGGFAVLTFGYVREVFGAAGSEALRSAAYRFDLLALLPEIEVIGLSDAFSARQGTVGYSGFESIDSALLLLGLRHGWIPLVLAGLLLTAVGVAVLLRRAGPGMVAVFSQIPALLSVALITQYAMFFWFIAGVAVAEYARHVRNSHAVGPGLGATVRDSADRRTRGRSGSAIAAMPSQGRPRA